MTLFSWFLFVVVVEDGCGYFRLKRFLLFRPLYQILKSLDLIFIFIFNATLMLEALRGKRMLFVGDSLNRGQFVSMVCLLHRLVPEDEKLMEDSYDSLTVFRLKEYNASIEFYWAPFLLESNSDNAVVHRIADRIVRKGSIKKHGDFWKGDDIMVFNTYLWWMTGLKIKILKGSFQDEEKEIEELSTEDAYRMAMKSMLHWVQRNMDPKKTRVFFTGMSPTHGKNLVGVSDGRKPYGWVAVSDDEFYFTKPTDWVQVPYGLRLKAELAANVEERDVFAVVTSVICSIYL